MSRSAGCRTSASNARRRRLPCRLNPDDRTITTTTSRHEFELARTLLGMTDIELAAMSERAAVAASCPTPTGRRSSNGSEAAGTSRCPACPSRRARGVGVVSYLRRLSADRVRRDGFIHLSGLHQVLTPANRFYAGRRDLVALVVDAHLISNAWGARHRHPEYFPHLYGARGRCGTGRDSVPPETDGSFCCCPNS